MGYLFVFLSGIVIGVANIIPGVSGGTMAVVLNIFDRLIGAISDLKKDFKKNALFLLTVGIGAGAGILAFTWLITWCLAHIPVATNFFFIGLILGSVPMIYKRATEDAFKAYQLIPFFIAFGVMLLTVVLSPGASDGKDVMEGLNVVNFIRLFLASVLSSACMIIPGISGSFVMLLLGCYTTVTSTISGVMLGVKELFSAIFGGGAINAAGSMTVQSLMMLLPIALGCVVGFFGGAKLIKLLLDKYPQATYFTILGLVIGSVPVIFKSVFWQQGAFVFRLSWELILALITAAGGFLLAYFLGSRIKEKKEKESEAADAEAAIES